MVDMKKNRDVLLMHYRRLLKVLKEKPEPSKVDLVQISLITSFINALFDLDKVDFDE